MPKGLCTFTVGTCNGTAGFRINQSQVEPNTIQEQGSIEFEYQLGKDIEFEMFGKQQGADTQVQDNRVVKDKFVRIETLELEYIKLENWQFHQRLFDPYFGFDREIRTLHIPENFIDWWLDYAI